MHGYGQPLRLIKTELSEAAMMARIGDEDPCTTPGDLDPRHRPQSQKVNG
jgi:hypothetical protein